LDLVEPGIGYIGMGDFFMIRIVNVVIASLAVETEILRPIVLELLVEKGLCQF
jgi:hypothetical protein